MPTTCLVHVFHPGQIMAAAASVACCGTGRESHGKNVQLVLYHPGFDQDNLAGYLDIAGKMTAYLGWEKPLGIDRLTMENIGRMKADRAVESFRQSVALETADEIHYPHDVVGQMVQFSKAAFPQAKLVMFGDTMGSVFNKEFQIATNMGKPPTEAICVGRDYALSSRGTKPDISCLILPVDQTGDILDQATLKVVPKRFVLDLINTISSNLNDVKTHCRELLKRTREPRVLFLTESIHEMGYTSLEGVVELQEQMIRANAPQGTRSVIIKEHPVTWSDVTQALKKRLNNDYNVQVVDRRYSRYPVEVFASLIKHCEIVTWSYAAISLKYLYGKHIHFPLTKKLVESYIVKKHHWSIKNSEQMVARPLENLASWDGKGLLWAGHYKFWEDCSKEI